MAITRTALDHDGFRGGIDVRVSLRDDAGSGDSAFDGAWWPRTRDLAAELPELIAELERRGVRVERFTYALDAWQPAPRKLVVNGRVVRTGGFRSMDPQVVCLAWARRSTPRRPARRPPGDRRAHRRPGAAAVHPPRPAALAADGAGRRPVHADPAGAGAAPPPAPCRRLGLRPPRNRWTRRGAAG